MNVIDASALVELLIRSQRAEVVLDELRNGPLAIPHLADVEVTSALRRLTMSGSVSEESARDAVQSLRTLPLVRFDHHPLLERIWALRHCVSAYDATYVALAEALEGTLLTADKPLASSSGHRAKMRLL